MVRGRNLKLKCAPVTRRKRRCRPGVSHRLKKDMALLRRPLILAKGNIVPPDTVLDQTSLPKVLMPNRDGFNPLTVAGLGEGAELLRAVIRREIATRKRFDYPSARKMGYQS